MNEKRQRDLAVFAAMGLLDVDDPPLTQTDAPSFDAGARGEGHGPDPRRRPYLYREGEVGGWYSVEVEDGASLLFTWLD